MSKHVCLFIFTLLVFPFSQALALNAGPRDLGFNGGINANPHNLSSLSNSSIHAAAGGENRICVFCHTPHGGAAQTQLWNRPDLANPDSSYPLYAGSVEIKTIAAAKYTNTDVNIQYPNGASRMCLSCHDGVTAIGEVISGAIIDASMTMSVPGSIQLDTSHPISFVYDTTVLAGIGTNKPGEYQLPLVDSQAPRDTLNRMQCTTCHDPHFDTKDATGYSLPFWRNYTNSASEAADYSTTCNACHLAAPTNGGITPPSSGGTQHQLP